MDPSEEQQTIIDNIKNEKNVVVDAVAGSGKSTTILFLAKQLTDKRILQVTYNSALRLEVKKKIEESEISNVQVHTFHSLAVRYYSPIAHTDTELRKILRNDVEPREKIPHFDIVVLDEVQDMTKLYFMFIRKFMTDMGKTDLQLLILGDFMQGLYEFKGSDVRYLTLADKIWNNFPLLKTNEFVSCSLKMSYRITNPMADFVNKVMLGEKRLLSCKEGSAVVYIRNSGEPLYMMIYHMIMGLLKEGNKPEDIFFLGPSMKNSIKKLENVLVERNIPCYVPMFDKEKIDDRVIDGKIVFSTFHSVKGRQRKFVFVTGFDNNYFEYFARNLERKKCPNTLYVGCTRATEKLFLIETNKGRTIHDKPLDFLKMNHLEMKKQPFIEFIGSIQMIQNIWSLDKTKSQKKSDITIHYNVSPTELIKFMPESVLEELIPLLENIFEKISKPEEEVELELPVVVQTKVGFHEDVADLNGIAIPCIYTDSLFQQEQKQENTMYDLVENILKDVKEGDHIFIKERFKEISRENRGIKYYLYLANIYSALSEKLYFKLSQIGRDEYTWLDEDIIEICMNRLDNVIQRKNGKLEVEVTIVNAFREEELAMINEVLNPYFCKERFIFEARIDMVCDDIWELKCTSTTSTEHFLQTMIYAWLWRVINPKDERKFKIFNIKTGEIYWLKKSALEDLTPLMVMILKSKYEKIKKTTDEEFLGTCG